MVVGGTEGRIGEIGGGGGIKEIELQWSQCCVVDKVDGTIIYIYHFRSKFLPYSFSRVTFCALHGSQGGAVERFGW